MEECVSQADEFVSPSLQDKSEKPLDLKKTAVEYRFVAEPTGGERAGWRCVGSCIGDDTEVTPCDGRSCG
jgi:hypothetical protein